jgi:hypothetical protein
LAPAQNLLRKVQQLRRVAATRDDTVIGDEP